MHCRLLSIILITLASFVGITGACAATPAKKVTLFAASSLTNAIDEITTHYEQIHSEKTHTEQAYPVEIKNAFAASSALARQISHGAPADIYLSANQKWMDYVVAKQVMDSSSRKTLLNNKLVVAAPLSSSQPTFQIDSTWPLASQLADQWLALADPAHVPAGQYAREALVYFNLWPSVRQKITRSNNTRSALVLIERQETPLGIIYSSDAKASEKVKVLAEFPHHSHAPIEYSVALTQKASPEAKAFYRFLFSTAAMNVFKKHGFEVTTDD